MFPDIMLSGMWNAADTMENRSFLSDRNSAEWSPVIFSATGSDNSSYPSNSGYTALSFSKYAFNCVLMFSAKNLLNSASPAFVPWMCSLYFCPFPFCTAFAADAMIPLYCSYMPSISLRTWILSSRIR